MEFIRGVPAEGNPWLLCEALAVASVELGSYDHAIVPGSSAGSRRPVLVPRTVPRHPRLARRV